MAAVRRRWCALTTLLLLLLVVTPAAAAPGDEITIASGPTPSAGLAADTSRGVYWLADQQADFGSVVAINPDGSVAGTVNFEVRPATIEALSAFDGLLYIGDLGDGASAHDSVRVYRLESLDLGTWAPYSEWTLHYPDGPHTAKAMTVSPRGNIWIITFGAPGGLYYAAAPGFSSGEIALERVADAPDWVTDAVFTGDTTAVFRTYNSVLTFDMENYVLTAGGQIPQQSQGESVTTALDGNGLVLGSVGEDRLLGVGVPTSFEQLPAAVAEPPGVGTVAEPTAEPTVEVTEPEPTPTQTEPPAAGNGTSSPINSNKTLLAMGIAVLVSLTAGLVAYFGRGSSRG